MTQPQGRVFVYRGRVPLWLVLAVLAPLGVVFLTSLVLAVAILAAAAALAALVLPFFGRRRSSEHLGAQPSSTIELDPSQYHRISDERRATRDE
jgi:hypothetical protein